MRILVTGGAGYIGSHAVRLFLAPRPRRLGLRQPVDGPSRRRAGRAAHRRRPGRDGSGSIKRWSTQRIEAVVHFAAFAYVGESVEQPAKYYQNNLVNTLNLLDAMRRQRIDRIVFSSTCATYGVPEKVPITEDEPQKPINPYGHTKLAVERALADYAAAYGWGFAALRYFNAAGASADGDIGEDHDPETHLIPLVLQAVHGPAAGHRVFGTDYPTPDGTCIRDYIHVDDLAEAHLLALENAGAGQAPALQPRHRPRLQRARGDPPGRGSDGQDGAGQGRAAPAGDPPALVAAAEKVQRELGWKPRYTDLRSIVETAWNWHQPHPKGYDDRANRR